MILPEHPDRNFTKLVAGVPDAFKEKISKMFGERKWQRAIGYWSSRTDPGLPDPKDYVDAAWDEKERDKVIAFLKKGRRIKAWMGYSLCRFCGERNGTQCLGNDDFVWPEGFGHYLEKHAVKPPQEFIDYVIAKTAKKPKGAAAAAVAEEKKDEAKLDTIDALDDARDDATIDPLDGENL